MQKTAHLPGFSKPTIECMPQIAPEETMPGYALSGGQLNTENRIATPASLRSTKFSDRFFYADENERVKDQETGKMN